MAGLETLREVQRYPICNGIPERGILPDVCKRFRIRQSMNETNGTIEAHFFPVTEQGILVGYVKRDLTQTKKDAFSMIGKVDITCDLLGQSIIPDSTRKVFTVEGVYDYLSLFQALYYSDYNSKRKDKIIPAVVSICLGTVNAAAQIGNNLEFFNRYSEKVFVFDNDSASVEEAKKGIIKGQDAVREVSLILPDIRNVLLQRNDPNDYLKHDESKLLNDTVLFDAKPYEAEFIVEGGISRSELLEPLKAGTVIPCLPKTSGLLHGLRGGEMTVILAPSGVGKTTVCKEIHYSLIKAGNAVGGIYLEESLKKSQQTMIALDNNIFLPKFRENPNVLPPEDFERSYNEIINNGRTMWLSHYGGLNSGTLMEKFRWMFIKRMGFIVLDHLSFVMSSSGSKDERKDIDLLLTNISSFCESTGVHVIVVSHITRKPKFPKKNSKGEIEYPWWDTVEMDQGRGSGALEQLPDNVLVLEPERLENNKRGRIRTVVKKNREWSWLGVGDIITMHPVTGRLISAENDYE